MKVGDRVVVRAQWSSFDGMMGRVEKVHPYLMVLFDEYAHPVRIEEPSVRLLDPVVIDLMGAE